MRQPKWLLEADDVAPPPNDGPNILIWDIESSPQLAYTWENYKTNVIKVVKPWYILSVAYKWFGEDDTHFVSIYQDPAFKPDIGYGKPKANVDRYVVARLWWLFDKADVLVAHNGDKFDIKKTQARMLVHGLTPPSPSKSIDTLKEVRRYGNFTSNRLNDLGTQLGLGEKEAHSGMHTWFGCMAGDAEQWRLMEKYNRRDITLLEDLYQELLPWIGTPGKANPGVNASVFLSGSGRPIECPKNGCGGTELNARGYTTTAAGLQYRRWQCKKCGGWSQSKFRDRHHSTATVK